MNSTVSKTKEQIRVASQLVLTIPSLCCSPKDRTSSQFGVESHPSLSKRYTSRTFTRIVFRWSSSRAEALDLLPILPHFVLPAYNTWFLLVQYTDILLNKWAYQLDATIELSSPLPPLREGIWSDPADYPGWYMDAEGHETSLQRAW